MECSTIKLSILICNLVSRKFELDSLLARLNIQSTPEVEILIETDNGELSVGAKRNKLLHRAKGEYIAFIDDDDDVSVNYIDLILDAIKDHPDCVGIEGILQSNKGEFKFKHSIEFQGWYTGVDAFYRTPNHLNPVKREIALRICFQEIDVGEDQYYSTALQRYIETEEYIETPIYFYKKEYLDT